MTDFISAEARGACRIVWLKRPRALNALDQGMIDALSELFERWVDDASVSHIIIRAEAGAKAFCAGGDIRAIHALGRSDIKAAEHFFRSEYALNGFLKRYPKPIISMIDGICMGGGMGLSMHGQYRIGTERCRFAMPEAKIGFFTDVGMTRFLSQLRDGIGTFLGMTGTEFYAATAYALGFLTHTIHSRDFEALFLALCDGEDVASLLEPYDSLSFAKGEGVPDITTLQRFGALCAEDVMALVQRLNLDQEDDFSGLDDEESALKRAFEGCCPLSVVNISEAIAFASRHSFETSLTNELQLAFAFLREEDFYEGVSARLIEKGRKPQWHKRYQDILS